MKVLKLFFGTLVLIFLLLGSNLNLAQAEGKKLTISPLTFKFVIDKGKSQSSIVTVTNPNDIEITITSSIEDFLVSDEEGTPRFIPEGAGRTTLASWITLDQTNFKIAPKKSEDVGFTITVPENAEPGGHYAAVFFKDEPQTIGGNQIGVATRVGALILVSVPGEVFRTGKIVEFKGPKFVDKGPVEFLARFKNTGTVHYQLGGIVTISNWLGRETDKISLPEHMVLPDNIRQFKEQWKAGYIFGKYKATLEMVDAEGAVHTAEITFFAFPWKEGIVVVGILILLITLVEIFKRKFKIVKKTNTPKEETKK